MKSGRKPNRKQTNFLLENGYDPKSWLIVKNLDHEIHIVHRSKDESAVIKR